ncbi:MAG: OmpA family protein [Alkalispirochaetaceae bacterium]
MSELPNEYLPGGRGRGTNGEAPRGRAIEPFTAALLTLLLLLLPGALCAQEQEGREFRFRFVEGERYRILGVNRQQVYLNGELSHSAVIVSRAVEEIGPVDEQGAMIVATYQLTEENLGGSSAFNLEHEYTARFERSLTGSHREIEESYMPVSRDYPRLPAGGVAPGESWSAQAREVHDFRRGYGIEEPYRFSMPVFYTYRGSETVEGRKVEVIEAHYNIFHRGPDYPRSPFYPRTITGSSEQELLWDDQLGRFSRTEEEYTFLFLLNTGDQVEYRGRATYEVVRIPSVGRQALRRELEEIRLPDTSESVRVEERDEGVTIILSEVYFEADSARLTDEARSTLAEISRVLGEVEDNELLVTGHTALAGTAAGREALSRERARQVAEAIVAGGSHREGQVLYRGAGARRPAASNATEAGRRLNRRVEITILE